MTSKELYLRLQNEWVKSTNAKVGDLVKVVSRAESHQLGWDNSGLGPLNHTVGETGEIIEMDIKGVTIHFGPSGPYSVTYPFFVLEIVPKPQSVKVRLNAVYVAEITKSGIQVGCQQFSFADLQKLASAIKKFRSVK